MKKAKKLLALLIAALMVAIMAIPAAAANPYGTVKPSVAADGLGIKETLEVIAENAPNPEVTYTLTLGELHVYSDNNITYGDTSDVKNANGVSSKELATVTFTGGAVTGYGTTTKNYEYSDGIIDAINALEFSKPGIYYWDITKTSSANSIDGLSNHNRSGNHNYGTALIIRVDDHNGTLGVTVGLNQKDSDGKFSADKNLEYKDNYNVAPTTLALEKEVEGNQGAKDQYFLFTVELTNMAGFNGATLTPTVTNGNSVSTALARYSENFTTGHNNGASVTVADGKATFNIWMKDDEKIQITGIPDGAKYKITESGNEGYTVTHLVEEGNNSTSKPGSIVDEAQLAATGTRVVYTNTKESTIPTGVILQKAAPIAGILLVIILGSVLLIGRRRRSEAE